MSCARHLAARSVPLAVAFVLALGAVGANAQWVWRGKDGHVTASDLPPPRDVADKDVLQRPDTARRAAAAAAAAAAASAPASASASTPVAIAKPPVDPQLEARRRATEQDQQARAQQQAKADEDRNAALRADNCARARQHLAVLDSGRRLARQNDRGEAEVLDDRGRADEARRANEAIAANCR